MQLMWLSGPTGQVKSISITARTVLQVALALGLGLMLFGFALNWIGLRFAVEYNPDLARSLGGVTTEAEQQKMEALYRHRLEQLRASVDQTVSEVKRLEAMKNRFMSLATPVGLKSKVDSKSDAKLDARGGPFVTPLFRNNFFRYPLQTELQQTASQVETISASLQSFEKQWSDHLSWLESLPIATPIHSDYRLSSGFGLRTDPFTGSLAMHEGIDFSAEIGTPVLATGPGIVTRSDWDSGYGHVIEVKHAENFMTRYAHLSKRHVNEGARVSTGARLGEVGSTGRSTGPHLHYEVFRNSRVLNPMQVLPSQAFN
jgi:murein DD-endopeptidase MepM/ murein hydrolase activator NlpD